MARLLVVIFPKKGLEWHFSKIFEVDSIPREGERIHCGEDYYLRVNLVDHDLLKNLAEINCDCDLSAAACWLAGIPGWEIWGEEEFRKDEAEIRRLILEHYEGDDFIPIFQKEED